MPVAEMEAGGEVLVNARQVPVAEELRNVGQLITEPRQVNADFPQLAQHGRPAARRSRAQVAIRPVQRVVQDAVVGFQLRQLQVGQLHHVERLLEVLRLIDNQRRVPIHDHQVVLIVAQETAGRFICFLLREVIDVRFLGQQGSHRPAMGPPPGLGADRRAFIGQQRRFKAEHRVGFFIGELLHGADVVRRQFAAHLFCQAAHFLTERAVAELQIVIGHEVFDLRHLERHPHADADRADRQQFDHPLDTHWAVRPNPLQRRQPHHLRPVEE